MLPYICLVVTLLLSTIYRFLGTPNDSVLISIVLFIIENLVKSLVIDSNTKFPSLFPRIIRIDLTSPILFCNYSENFNTSFQLKTGNCYLSLSEEAVNCLKTTNINWLFVEVEEISWNVDCTLWSNNLK